MLAVLAFVAAASMNAGAEMRDIGLRMPLGVAASVTIDAPAYTRTVTASSYTLTGSATGTTTDASSASTSLLLKMGGRDGQTTTTDQSATPKTMTVAGGAALSTVTKKYGSGSMAFSARNTQRISTPDSADFTLGSGDWTIEAWVNFGTVIPAAGNYPTIIGQRNSANVDHAFTLEWNGDTSELEMVATTDGTIATLQRFASSWVPSTSTWYHVAIARSGSSVRLFVDGTQIGTTKTFSGTIWDSSALLSVGHVQEVGAFATGIVAWGGWIDEVRLTKGVGRYTGTFTPGELPPEEVWYAASPSTDDIGTCTGTAPFSCVVVVEPDTAGDGIETITVTQKALTDTETLGFYVALAHTAFLSQNVDGSYNSTLADLDAVSTWENVGTSALDVTQPGAATLKPTFRTGIASGQPTVLCDGGDVVTAASAADWPFLNNGTDFTVDVLATTQTTSSDQLMAIVGTTDGNLVTNRGFLFGFDDRNTSGRNDTALALVSNGTSLIIGTASANNTAPSAKFDGLVGVLDEGSGSEWNVYANGSTVSTTASVTGYSASNPIIPLSICQTNSLWPMTGSVFRVMIYQSALSSTQRAINKAVDEWALGGTQPTSLVGNDWLFLGDSLSTSYSGVTAWPDKLTIPSYAHEKNLAVGGYGATQILTSWQLNASPAPEKIFILGGINDIAGGTSAATTYASLSPIYSAASAAGSQVIAMPTLPFGNAATWLAAEQTQLELLEASIIADGNVDVVVNFYDLMGEPGTPIDLAAIYDSGDGLHPNDAGTTFMAAEVDSALGL